MLEAWWEEEGMAVATTPPVYPCWKSGGRQLAGRRRADRQAWQPWMVGLCGGRHGQRLKRLKKALSLSKKALILCLCAASLSQAFHSTSLSVAWRATGQLSPP